MLTHSQGGIFLGTDLTLDLSNKNFYGFKFNNKTGDLVVDVVSRDGVVKLPEEGFLNSDDYKQFFWSSHAINFYFDSKGHLIMEIL